VIEIKGVYKEFKGKSNKVEALKNINMHIEQGDIFGIIGLSGAGKSTLVRCINRLEEPTKGEVYIKGKNIMSLNPAELREMRKKIGMIFQHFNLLNSRTVAENIAYPMEIAKVPKEDREKRIDELLKLVELEEKRDSYPSQLSGGQKQRVGIARALANHPDVLLCDEATSALDPKTTQSILKLLKKINETLGLTIVIITHEMEVIKQICSKVAVMEAGEVVETGPVSKVFAHPTHPTTKSFVQNISHDIPEELLDRIDERRKLFRLSFEGIKTSQPILSKMIKKCGVDANILLGGIDHLQQTFIGSLIIELIGDKEEIKNAVAFLEENGVECEVISQ
jgi:D-methionine transport system ATP-binding protein